MKLGINIVRFTRKFTGVGRYMECVLKEWAEMDIPFDEVILYTPAPISQDNVIFPLDKFKVEVIESNAPDPVWETMKLKKVSSDVDVLFCPSYTAPIGYPGKSVVAYLGPSENTFPTYQWWRSRAYDRLHRYSARRADRVMVCSEIVRKRVIDIFRVPEEKVKVTYLAASDVFRPINDEKLLNEVKQKYLGCQSPFILFVGKLARRHYIPNMLEAFARVKKEHGIPHKLLLAGPDYLNLDVPARANRLGVGDDVVHIPFIKHLDLAQVYNAADIFIFPVSDAEGFGIPVIEAMQCGTPTISANKGSVAEFAPGAAYLANDSGTDNLKKAIEKMALDSDLRKELGAKGLERAKTITWKFTAEKTMKELWDVANS